MQHETVKSDVDLMPSAGLAHADDVTSEIVPTQIDLNKVETFTQKFPKFETGCILVGSYCSQRFFVLLKLSLHL